MSTSAGRNLVFIWLAAITGSLGWIAWSQAQADRKVTSFDKIKDRKSVV